MNYGITLVFFFLVISIILIAVYKVVIKKRNVKVGYTPFDDATQGIKPDQHTEKNE
ncbi:hypothetical protein HNO89_003530 [Sporosarcina luteola]|nr:hypothetical protein [Sporosarcina luteola]